MANSLLVTKYHVPVGLPRLVSRSRLLQRLDEGWQRGQRLTLISTPAGFGKTSLLTSWAGLAVPSTLPVAWLSLDEGDNDPVRFLSYLVAALHRADQDIGAAILDGFRPLRHSGLRERLIALLNQISASLARRSQPAPCGLLLVLDDYHLITAEPVHRLLGFLLDHLPPRMHVVIAARADPPLSIARLRAQGQLNELREADLRFSAAEASQFLSHTMGLQLAEADVAALTARTEGWIAGLQIAAVSMQAHGDAERLVQAFSGSNRHVLDYLAQEVLERQPDDVRHFLLQTAILDRLTGSLCDALFDSPSAATGRQMLERLEAVNLFIVPLDDRREWYRYHRLFADLLRHILTRTQPHKVGDLHRRASLWHEQHGLPAEAIDHALQASDYERAGALIEQVAETTLMSGQFTTLLRWMEALPDAVECSRPLLCVSHGWALLFSEQPQAEVARHIEAAQKSDTTGDYAGALAALRAIVALFAGDVDLCIELCGQAAQAPAGQILYRAMVPRVLGMAHLLRGDVLAAGQVFADDVKTLRQAGDVVGTMAELRLLASTRTVQGRLREAQRLFEEALSVAPERTGAFGLAAIRAQAGLADILRERNELEAARTQAIQASRLSEGLSDIYGISACIVLARTSQALGDVSRALAAMQRAAELGAEYRATELDDLMIYAHRARLWLMQGNVEAAAAWAAERRLSQAQAEALAAGAVPMYHIAELECVVLARIYLAQGRPDGAAAALEPLLRGAEERGRYGSVIEILTLQACALQAQGNRPAALATLARALDLAEPEGYMRLFADEGEPMADLLNQAVAQGIRPAYARRLLDACAAAPVAAPPPAPSAGPSLVEPLSRREMDVLRLMAAGMSNPEIARELVVSVDTVRSHCKSIYGKLGAHRRWEAIRRAQELRLL